VLGLAFVALSPPACRGKRGAVEVARSFATRSYDDFKDQVGKLQVATLAVRARLKDLPEDLPGLEPIHSMLLSIEEVVGVEGARVKWLSGELNTALRSGDLGRLKKISDEIRAARDGDRGIEKAILTLTRQLRPFEALAIKRRPSGSADGSADVRGRP